ncbi:MAG: GNAT family N-acetyltransferase [Bryobacteraceae bacterium]
MDDIILTPADESMRAAAARLLASNGLVALEPEAPLEDRYVAALVDGELIGMAGFELHGGAALLRSVAVDAEFRGRGLGAALVTEALEGAAAAGARTVYLLTEGAADYFARFGFSVIGRGEGPAGIAETSEWRVACPASATAMRLELG